MFEWDVYNEFLIQNLDLNLKGCIVEVTGLPRNGS
ncbi:hypothetical protein Belba_1351 [Belliella baltica DSM 15883]|uniref:Uncharacterized protein n=1 Tax=Belliella baltica (strain DSM 15883 / CIP 108006 / LMG 21964 / BA134) TaxID=866536 RepID=I3Z407_BELBD|nr:hypothetical protein Belba_1351 [Belliella baltica DSM 15883]